MAKKQQSRALSERSVAAHRQALITLQIHARPHQSKELATDGNGDH